MHPRNTFVIQNNLIILPLKKSTVYSTYMLTIIIESEREKSKRKKHNGNFSVWGSMGGGKGSSLQLSFQKIKKILKKRKKKKREKEKVTKKVK